MVSNECPECAGSGKISPLEYLIHDDVTLVLCADNDCPINYRGRHIVRRRADSPLPAHLRHRLCSPHCPPTILAEPRLKYKHVTLISWLVELRKGDIYGWLEEEVRSMAYSRSEHLLGRQEARYRLTPSAKRLMDLSEEEVAVGKHVVPDLTRVVRVLKEQYRIHLLSQSAS